MQLLTLSKTVSQIVFLQNSQVLFESNSEAAKHIVDVSLGERSGVLEARAVIVQIVMVLDGLDYVSLSN